MLLQKLTLPILGTDDETNPPWDHLSVLFSITPHLIAAVAVLSASVLPFAEGQTVKVGLVCLILALQVGLRAWGDFTYRRRPTDALLKTWLDRFVWLSIASGVAWGSALAILYTGGGPDTQVVVLAVGCGILQSSAARAYLAPRSTILLIVIITALVNAAAIREGNWIMVPICTAYVGFLASYMVRLIALDEKRIEAERKTRELVDALADSNEKLTRANEQLRRHARTDSLTGLDNRRGFDEELSRRLDLMRNTGRPLAILLIDVDHFKRFNDTHGHQAGDRCLQTVAELLQDCIAQADGVAARYGGEEFVILLQGPVAEQPIRFAEQLRTLVSQLPLPTENGGSASLTISIGVAVADQHEDEASLVATADRRLYKAKADGRNRVCDSDDAERLLGQA